MHENTQRSSSSKYQPLQLSQASRRRLPYTWQSAAGPKSPDMNLFRSRPDTSWISAGPASSFPNLGQDASSLVQPQPCHANTTPGCKIFHVPKDQPSQASEVRVSTESLESAAGDELKDQVLVFQYRGNFHAVDHVSFLDVEFSFVLFFFSFCFFLKAPRACWLMKEGRRGGGGGGDIHAALPAPVLSFIEREPVRH